MPEPHETLLYLVRHGATPANEQRPYVLQGRGIDTSLSDTGQQQAAAVAEFLADRPLDENRQIIAGHTPVQKLGTFGVEPPSDGIWTSTIKTVNGSPAVLLIDTGVVLERSLRPRLSAIDLQTGRVEDVERIESFNEG